MQITHLEITHPNCVICGKTWASLPEDPTTMWCSPEDDSHDTIWGFMISLPRKPLALVAADELAM